MKVPLDHNAEMKPYEVTIDVKDNARVVEYGASIAGDGEFASAAIQSTFSSARETEIADGPE